MFPKIYLFFLLILGCLNPRVVVAEVKVPFDAGRVSSGVKVNDLEFDYHISPLFVLPNELVKFEFEFGSLCQALAGEIISNDSSHCTWKAPDSPGAYSLNIGSKERAAMTFNILVMLPFDSLQGEYLNNYRIGRYPVPGLDGEIKEGQAYINPKGFIEITSTTEQVKLTPHFSLGQFACKQSESYPKYVVLKEKLLLKLERILEEVNRNGLRTDSFHVMSGYRTPYYNRAIENVSFSRHVFGDAADVFVPRESQSDLKKHGSKDVTLIYRLVDRLERSGIFQRFVGGMGFYNATSAHPFFVHVDTRGHIARW